MSSLESALEKMAESAAREVEKNCILGLGSGSTVARFARALGKRNQKEKLNLKVVPSSMQAWLLAKDNELALYEDSAHCPEELDLAVDGADQISTETRAMIKGGGGALFKEKILLSSSKRCLILADQDKFVKKLDRAVPVEVSQFSLSSVAFRIKKELHGEPLLRKLDKGYPFYTESGNVILDCQFSTPITTPEATERALKALAGVVEVGIFTCRVDRFYKANRDVTFESF